MWRKRLADLLTGSRLCLSLTIAVLGIRTGIQAVETVIPLLLVAWTTDILDGPLARSSGCTQQTWIGTHDLSVDICLGTSLLICIAAIDWWHWATAAVYLLLGCAVLLSHDQVPKCLGALFQGPVYVSFAVRAIAQSVCGAWLLPAYAVTATAVTWRRFSKQIMPEFFGGVRREARRLRAR